MLQGLDRKTIIILIAIAGVLVFLMSKKGMMIKNDGTVQNTQVINPETPIVEQTVEDSLAPTEESPSTDVVIDKLSTNVQPSVLLEQKRNEAPLETKDLLPHDDNQAWSTVNPKGEGSLTQKNFLEATHHFGVDTIGSSLRNANWSVRSEPPNPRQTVSPWSNSTITVDTNRRPLEIGGDF